MTPAFEHHDTIAGSKPGTWLRATGVLTGRWAMETHKIVPGTLLRVEIASGFDACVLYDAGDRLVRTMINSEWYHCLEVASPDERNR